MRNEANVFYYADSSTGHTTLIKAILFFDEIHFMDRPSLMFGNAGSIGSRSPLRQYEEAFRDEGIPFFVHAAPNGQVQGEWYDQIRADVNDLEFLREYQRGIERSPTFRNLQIPRGNYGEFGDQDDVAETLMSIDLSAEWSTHENSMGIFDDAEIKHFDLSTPLGAAKNLIYSAVICSAKLNFALSIAAEEGFIPLADAKPYSSLLRTKYARAMNALGPITKEVQFADLSFAIFDELVPNACVERMSLADAICYRKASKDAREEFLEHLGSIQARQASLSACGDSETEIVRLIEAEIKPAVRVFKNQLETIDESLVGTVAKGLVGVAGSGSAVSFFGDLSWPNIMALTGIATAYLAKGTIDALLAERSAKRECSLSYVLSLDGSSGEKSVEGDA